VTLPGHGTVPGPRLPGQRCEARRTSLICYGIRAFAGGGRDPGGTMGVLYASIACHEGRPPADVIFSHVGCCPQLVPA
jgi:hypothetical protein